MRAISLLLLTPICLTCSACSYMTDFVVINSSAQPIDVQYRVKPLPGEFAPADKPAIIAASQLDSHFFDASMRKSGPPRENSLYSLGYLLERNPLGGQSKNCSDLICEFSRQTESGLYSFALA